MYLLLATVLLKVERKPVIFAYIASHPKTKILVPCLLSYSSTFLVS